MVVTGAGDRAFCSGADLKDMEAIIDRAGGTRRAPLGFSEHEPGKPRIAAVEGWCIAGGIELACWCDFTVAGRRATFAAFSRRWGVPWVDGGTQRMTRKVGTGNALYVLESGEPIDAPRALAMGLVQEVVPAGQALSRAVELAGRIAAFPQWSLRADRRAVLEGMGLPLEEGTGPGGGHRPGRGERRAPGRCHQVRGGTGRRRGRDPSSLRRPARPHVFRASVILRAPAL
jgi:enoyl-CoA hydratase